MSQSITMIPFIDLKAQQARIREGVDAAIQRVLDHGKYIMGPEVAELENQLCQFTGSKHCIGVSDGTSALVAALMAYGIGPGDAVITAPFTFFATAEAIMMLGATPVFADIDPVTFNLCPQALEDAILKTQSASQPNGQLKLRGIIPVDLFGLAADYSAINTIAEQHGLFVLQDAAQGCGALHNGIRAPKHGHVGTTSFFPAKPLGCYGDGGAIFTDDDELAEIIRSIRVHGKGTDKYDNIRVGQNCRLDSIQAAVLLEKLKIYESEIDARQKVADAYDQQIKKLNESLDTIQIIAPRVPDGYQSVWAQYTIRVPDRQSVSEKLKEQGVPSVVYYRTPLHLAKACSGLGYQAGDFPHSERASNEVLSLPFHPYLDESTIRKICKTEIFAKA